MDACSYRSKNNGQVPTAVEILSSYRWNLYDELTRPQLTGFHSVQREMAGKTDRGKKIPKAKFVLTYTNFIAVYIPNYYGFDNVMFSRVLK